PLGALAGVPVAIMDVLCVQGGPTTCGSRMLEEFHSPYDATVISRLTAAGAVRFGKTNMDEFAMGSSNENSAYGPVLNPWDRGRVPGGSSGGSAAAVAGGLAPAALGTDTGGSIRQPAALCGIVGMKPTYGAVSRFGMIAFASSLDQAGPLTRDVTDAALLLGHMIGRDPRDATSLEFPDQIRLPSAESLAGVRLGVPSQFIAAGIEAGVLEQFERALAAAAGLRATIDSDVELPHAPHGLSAYYVLAPAEASSNLARFDGVRYGLRSETPDRHGEGALTGMYRRTRHDGFGPEVRRRIMLGTYALSAGYYDAYYGRAQRVRTKIADDFRDAFAKVDFILSPTTSEVAFELGAKSADPWAMYLNDYFTVPMSLAGIPAISIPCGLSRGLPVGLQICGPPFSENRLLEVAYALERALAFDGSAARV
ncbi:MAG: Asp-tRNA(Asn)/Glu-tRNA(Gln) amidotransferase subunit GatA, partial [Solirubrobacterales bacterium]|nr:Asp-tRNA(Asn)/Glu-tRNA(Gln) amidotransferase subunit GatA [Solirubrobacterales bacterium]